jgi:hypothetical protein
MTCRSLLLNSPRQFKAQTVMEDTHLLKKYTYSVRDLMEKYIPEVSTSTCASFDLSILEINLTKDRSIPLHLPMDCGSGQACGHLLLGPGSMR